jgi:predicted ribosome quality control (RQC) complex YloA/Tae2 family protein
MSFDGIFTHLMVQELQKELINGRVNKIHQPYENEVSLRNPFSREKSQITTLCPPELCSNSMYTEAAYSPIPKHRLHFLMMLRKVPRWRNFRIN